MDWVVSAYITALKYAFLFDIACYVALPIWAYRRFWRA